MSLVKIMLLFVGIVIFSQNASAEKPNLVRNSSFELGMPGFECKRWMFFSKNPDLKPVMAEFDTSTKVHGNVSLKINNPFSDHFSVLCDELKLIPGKEYTFSLWAKSSKNFALRVLCESVGYGSKWSAGYLQIKTGKAWKRYHKTFTVPSHGANQYYTLRIETTVSSLDHKRPPRVSCDVWIDAIQVSAGKLKDYKPASEVEAVICLDKNFPLYKPGEAVTGKIRAIAYSGQTSNIAIQLDIFNDYWESRKAAFTTNLKLKSKKVIEKPFSLTENIRGGYTLEGKILKLNIKTPSAHFAVANPVGKNTNVKMEDFSLAVNFTPYPNSLYGTGRRERFHLARHGQKSFDDVYRYFSTQGVRWFRDWGHGIINWSEIEPEPGKFNWKTADKAVNMMLKHNIKLLPVFGGDGFYDLTNKNSCVPPEFPQWVRKRSKIVPIPTSSSLAAQGYNIVLPPVDDWKNYIKAVVGRYKGKITHYEIMNEANAYLLPKQYIKYLKAAYEAAKGADPNCKIVGFCATGDLGCVPGAFLNECIKLGGLKYADIVSFHPYNARLSGTPVTAQAQIAEMKNMMKKNGFPNMPLWNTELYYLNEEFVTGIKASEIKGNEIARRFFIDLGEGISMSFCMPRYSNGKRTVARHRREESNSVTALIPSFRYVIYMTLAKYFEGAKPVTRIKWPNRNICYVFEKNGQLIAVVWNYDRGKGDALNINLSPSQVKILDMFGNPVKTKETSKICLKLGNEPYYIFWKGKNREMFLNALKKSVLLGDVSLVMGEPKVVMSNGKPHLIVEIKNMTDKKIKGLIKITSAPEWMTCPHKAIPYGPVQAYKSMFIAIPVKTKSKQDGTATISISVSTENEVFKFKRDVCCPLLLHCKKMIATANIDGHITMGEWGDAKRIMLDKINNVKLGKAGKWTGPNDCSAIVRSAYDNKNIYFAVSVKDDMKGKRFRNSVWSGDAVELFLHTSLKGGKHYTPKTWQLTFAPASAKKLPNCSSRIKNIKWKTKRNNNGYELELAIPFKELGLKASEMAGGSIDFDIAIDDADKGTRETQLLWSGGTDNYKNRLHFGRLYFEK